MNNNNSNEDEDRKRAMLEYLKSTSFSSKSDQQENFLDMYPIFKPITRFLSIFRADRIDWLPDQWIKRKFERVAEDYGPPVWLSVAIGAFTLRTIMLPINLKRLREIAKIEPYAVNIMRAKAIMIPPGNDAIVLSNSRYNADSTRHRILHYFAARKRYRRELREIYQRADYNRWWFWSPIPQAGMIVLYSLTCHRMFALDMQKKMQEKERDGEGIQEAVADIVDSDFIIQGGLWFKDLYVADPYSILPVYCVISTIVNLHFTWFRGPPKLSLEFKDFFGFGILLAATRYFSYPAYFSLIWGGSSTALMLFHFLTQNPKFVDYFKLSKSVIRKTHQKLDHVEIRNKSL